MAVCRAANSSDNAAAFMSSSRGFRSSALICGKLRTVSSRNELTLRGVKFETRL